MAMEVEVLKQKSRTHGNYTYCSGQALVPRKQIVHINEYANTFGARVWTQRTTTDCDYSSAQSPFST